MTLRVRLTLITALTVALVLLGSGIGLHFLLRASLYQGLDDSLRQAVILLSGFVEIENGTPELELEGEVPPGLDSDLTAFLLSDRGEVLARIGAPLVTMPEPRLGYGTQGELRVLGERVTGATLLVARSLDSVEDSVARFDASFLILAPVALLVTLGLSYLLVGRGLAPVDRLTRAAFDLAQRRAWRERLPEPERRDELWRLASATNQLLAALVQVIESERRFTSDAAHELRTPLTVLRGRLEQALEDAPDDDRLRERLQRAITANEELLHLTETLLLLARAEAGQGMTPEHLAIDEVAFDTAERMRPLFGENGLALALDLPDEPVWVQGDAATLGALVRNLLDNALKFTAHGGVRLEVRKEETQAHVTVEDTGPGFPEGELSRVFERFYQTDVHHRRTGSGLGLALARSIAQWHGGRLEAANRAEGGARVTLHLPLANAPTQAATATREYSELESSGGAQA